MLRNRFIQIANACLLTLIGFCFAGSVQAAVNVSYTNPLIEYHGVAVTKDMGDHMAFQRFHDEVYTRYNDTYTRDHYDEYPASTTSGVHIRFTTSSPTVSVQVVPRFCRWRDVEFGVYQNGKVSQYCFVPRADFTYSPDSDIHAYGEPYTLPLIRSVHPGEAVTYELVLPSLANAGFVGLELEDGYSLVANPVEDKPYYVAFGDGITQGLGQDSQSHRTYPWILAEMSGWELFNQGISFSTATPELADVLDPSVVNLWDGKKPSVVTILWGYHDRASAILDKASFRQRMELICEKVDTHTDHAEIFCITPIPTTNEEANTGSDNGRTIQEYRDIVVDVVSDLRGAGKTNFHLIHGDALIDPEDIINNGIHLGGPWNEKAGGAAKFAAALYTEIHTVLDGSAPAPVPLSASIEARAPIAGESPLEVDLSAFVFGGQDPYTFSWDLDEDGLKDSGGLGASKIYYESGNYDVSLTVTDALGATVTVTQTDYLQVLEPLVPPVIIAPDDTRLQVIGANYSQQSVEGLEFMRFRPAYYDMTLGELGAIPERARTTTGSRLRFRTDSENILVKFHTRPDDENRNSDFGIYFDGSWQGRFFTNKSYSDFTIPLVNPVPGQPLTVDLVMPNWSNPILSEIQLDAGSQLFSLPALTKKTYVALGDSITHGTGQKATYEGYPFLLSEAIDYDLYNLAVGGSQIAPNLAACLEDFSQVDLITILIGFNDWNMGKTLEEYRADYHNLLDTIRAAHPSTPIVCMRLTYTDATESLRVTDETIEGFREAVSQVVQERIAAGDLNIHVVAGEDFFTGSSYLSDKVHPNATGAQAMADALIPLVEAILAGSSEPTLADWMADRGVSGDLKDSDSDGDGMPLLLEYFVDSDPSQPQVQAHYYEGGLDAEKLSLKILSNRSSAPADLSVELQGSDDLGITDPWVAVGMTSSVQDNGDGTWTHIYTQSQPITGSGKNFIRLFVSE